MSRTDLISDVFTIIRNASRASIEEAYVPRSNSVLKICEILKAEGYLENFKEVDLENHKKIKLYLKYNDKKPAVTQIKKVSRPGRRMYVDSKSIPRALDGYGVTIVSTSSGIVTGVKAKEMGLGGEVIGMVW